MKYASIMHLYFKPGHGSSIGVKGRNDVNGAPNNSRIIDVRGSRILALIQDMLFIKRGLESRVHKQNTKRNTTQWQPVECLARVNLPMPQV